MTAIRIIAISVVFMHIGVDATKETLRLGVLISQQSNYDFSGFIPAMELALETIENDTTLPFRFTITLNDSKVRTYIAITC